MMLVSGETSLFSNEVFGYVLSPDPTVVVDVLVVAVVVVVVTIVTFDRV